METLKSGVTLHKKNAMLLILLSFLCPSSTASFSYPSSQPLKRRCTAMTSTTTRLSGWLDAFNTINSEKKKKSSSSSSSSSTGISDLYYDRMKEFPEQYPATYELLGGTGTTTLLDITSGDALLVRPLLKNTQLESRPLQVAYNANWQGWNARAFHKAVDGKGAAIVACKARGQWFGGYNPKGWSSNGGARPSVAAFLWYRNKQGKLQKLQKIGGGGLACAKDDPDTGIWLGADGLVIPMAPGRPRDVDSRLGTYFERGMEGRYSIVPDGAYQLEELKVLVGVYQRGEEIPYSGAVLDFTSG